MNCWVSEVVKESKALNWPGIIPDQRSSFKGDALEILCEYLMKVLSLADNQGLQGYKPVPLRDDYGVDAVGVKNGVTVVVQCKFRENPTCLVHYADLARTFTQGVLMCGVDPKQTGNVWLVTTAKDANQHAKAVLGKHLHVIGVSHLRKNLDGNTAFWQGLLASL